MKIIRGGNKTVVAVMKAHNPQTAETKVFVAINGSQQAVPAAWRSVLATSEAWVPGQGLHAEENILNSSTTAGWSFIEGGTTMNVCDANTRCGLAITSAGMKLGGPPFPGNQGTVYRLFWRQ